MLVEFLEANRRELIERCLAKVASRPVPLPAPRQMEHGVPLFLGHLVETLRAEEGHGARLECRIPAPEGSAATRLASELARSAAAHGLELLHEGFAVEQVVHDYGDLCQAVTELAFESNAAISVAEFHTLNRCLDNAIAAAVTSFDRRRDQLVAETGDRARSEQLGYLAHELRNFLNTAVLSFAAIKSGSVAVNGITSAALDRSLVGLRDLIDNALADARLATPAPSKLAAFGVDRFIGEIKVEAGLGAKASGCEFVVMVEAGLAIRGDAKLLQSAVSNLLQNAFKFTRPRSQVSLRAYGAGERVLIEVQDECGGLPEGKPEALFRPFRQYHADRSGLGLGLSISRRAVEACQGALRVRDMPGIGCVFTIDLPRELESRAAETVLQP
jgi:signal transduction histidine kinase